jgi:hypothetical protein
MITKRWESFPFTQEAKIKLRPSLFESKGSRIQVRGESRKPKDLISFWQPRSNRLVTSS